MRVAQPTVSQIEGDCDKHPLGLIEERTRTRAQAARRRAEQNADVPQTCKDLPYHRTFEAEESTAVFEA